MSYKLHSNSWIRKILCFYFVSLVCYGYSADTTKIVFFQDSNIQQYCGIEWHRMSKKIPKGKYKQAILRVDIGCASYGCCAWDYSYRGFISKKINDTTYRDYEVARLITPYSSYMRKKLYGYDSTWTHPYLYDVTDYLPLLLDSGDIFYSAWTGGWDNKGKFGFKHTITLYLIEGENLSPVHDIHHVYHEQFRYHDSAQFDQITPAYTFHSEIDYRPTKFRMIFTGHDQHGEFTPIDFYLKIQDSIIYTQRIWKTDCDQNPIQPQSGTWIFSRTNWCPGEKVYEVEVDISPYIRKGKNILDIALGRLVTTDSVIQAKYQITGDIIAYQRKEEWNARLEDILSPNTDPRYTHLNPTSMDAKIRVRNTGKHLIRDLHFEYGTSLGKIHKYSWHGSLPVDQTIDIKLPMQWNVVDNGSGLFIVKMIRSTQNRTQELDVMASQMPIIPKFHTKDISYHLKTSNDSSINTLELYNALGHRIYYRNFYNDTSIYSDTFSLPVGAYRLELLDWDKNYECGDGLEFWFSTQVYKKKAGSFELRDAATRQVLKSFIPDFGRRIRYEFIID